MSELVVSDLVAGYGRIRVVEQAGFRVAPSEIVALAGRNGAGKTTLLRAVAGLRKGASGGSVTVDGTELGEASPETLVAAGLKLVSEGRRVFREMSVISNLRLGAFSRRKQFADDDLDLVFELFPVLRTFAKRRVADLSGGQQQMVAIGQALMSKPRFLLLDEPTSGLAPVLIDDMYDAFRRLRAEGIGMLIVDQNVERVLELSSRYYVLDAGRMACDGPCDDTAIGRVNEIVMGVVSNADRSTPT